MLFQNSREYTYVYPCTSKYLNERSGSKFLFCFTGVKVRPAITIRLRQRIRLFADNLSDIFAFSFQFFPLSRSFNLWLTREDNFLFFVFTNKEKKLTSFGYSFAIKPVIRTNVWRRLIKYTLLQEGSCDHVRVVVISSRTNYKMENSLFESNIPVN